MRFDAVVLDEDSRADDGFMLHDLVCAMVADELHPDDDRGRAKVLARVDGRAMNANNKVFAALQNADRFDCPTVLGVFDSDRIRSMAPLSLPPATSLDVVEEELLRSAGASPPRFAAFLVANAESVIEAVLACVDGIDPVVVSKARAKKRNERDLVLKKAAYGSRAVRDCVRSKVGSIDSIRDRILSALRR